MRSDDRIQKAIMNTPNIWDDNKNQAYFGLPLEQALAEGVPDAKCFNYRLEIGGESYIGFTTQDPQARLAQHIQDAKNGSKQDVHVALRRFGYLCDLEVLGEYKNEILGLVAEISNIKKYKSGLNTSIGGEGNKYEVFERANEFGELAFYVRLKKSKKVEQERNAEFRPSNLIRGYGHDSFSRKYGIKRDKLNSHCIGRGKIAAGRANEYGYYLTGRANEFDKSEASIEALKNIAKDGLELSVFKVGDCVAGTMSDWWSHWTLLVFIDSPEEFNHQIIKH